MSNANKVVELAKNSLKLARTGANWMGASNIVFFGLVGAAGLCVYIHSDLG